MAELNKGALTSENNNSFPNNNTGFITPTLLRTFNGNMIDSMVDEISYNVDSSSFNTRINAFATASIPAGTVSSSAQIAGLGYATTSSVSQSVQSLNSATSSYITSAQTASMTVLSASFAQTASYALFAETSSFALTSSITQQVSTSISTQNLQHNVLFIDTTGPGLVQVDGGLRYNPNTNLLTTTASLSITASYALNANVDSASLVTTSSFNTYTASNDSKVDSLINKTGSFITTGSSALTQNITGSLIISGAAFNGKIEAPALSIGTTTLDVLFESTASTSASNVASQIDFTRLGAGATGDLTGVRLQTLSGSDTAGDTLLSRITTGVNRHTTTAMTGSVVNTSILSTWATGSAGARVTYTSQVNANAQSASATLTLTAGNAAANYGGGTASFQAGRVNIGATGATINITGSNPNILSGSLSGSLISNLGDIYTGSNNANFIVTLGSASMASLLAGSATNANTLYFVI